MIKTDQHESAQAIDKRYYRDILSCYPTGVCLVTAQSVDGERYGLVVGSFTSISLDPPLVGFFPDKRSSTWPKIEATGRFCVNILASHQPDICRRFVAKAEDKFGDLPHEASPAGLPLLNESVAWIDCSIERILEVGDHWLAIGAVEAMGTGEQRNALTFFRGVYHDLVALG